MSFYYQCFKSNTYISAQIYIFAVHIPVRKSCRILFSEQKVMYINTQLYDQQSNCMATANYKLDHHHGCPEFGGLYVSNANTVTLYYCIISADCYYIWLQPLQHPNYYFTIKMLMNSASCDYTLINLNSLFTPQSQFMCQNDVNL